MYGKQTQRAIGAMSRLAEVWDGGRTRLSAVDIAKQRSLPGPMLAKILTSLSQAKLIVGSPGPGGGYALSRQPSLITLQEVADVFEREDTTHLCPFKTNGICGVGDPCAMHDKLVEVQKTQRAFLSETTFEIFRLVPAHANGAADRATIPETPRESYRAREPKPI